MIYLASIECSPRAGQPGLEQAIVTDREQIDASLHDDPPVPGRNRPVYISTSPQAKTLYDLTDHAIDVEVGHPRSPTSRSRSCREEHGPVLVPRPDSRPSRSGVHHRSVSGPLAKKAGGLEGDGRDSGPRSDQWKRAEPIQLRQCSARVSSRVLASTRCYLNPSTAARVEVRRAR